MKAPGISLTGFVAALAVVCAFATSASAGNTKPYSLVVAPALLTSGSQATITATFKNLTSQQQFGSANLTPPAGYTVTTASITAFSFSPAPPTPTATIVSNVVQLRGLSVPPGQSVKVTMSVKTPCTAGPASWKSVVKQANDFNGPPGSDLALDASKSSTTTTTTGGCGLVFSTEPKDAQVGATITGIAGNPAGPPVAVSVVDGAGNPTSAAIAITVGLGAAPAGAALNGTKTVTSSNGVAMFGNLSVTKPGTYTLSATSPGAGSATSSSFRADQAVVTCPNNVFCTAFASTTGTVPGSNPPVQYTNTIRVDQDPNPDDGGVPYDGGTLAVSYNVGPSFTLLGVRERLARPRGDLRDQPREARHLDDRQAAAPGDGPRRQLAEDLPARAVPVQPRAAADRRHRDERRRRRR